MNGRFLDIAVIGAGPMANDVHCPTLLTFPNVRIAAICDRNPDRLSITARNFRIDRIYTDYRKMVTEVAPAAVFAIGQPEAMYEAWMWCLSQGIHLFIEKPMGLTIHQAESLARTAESHGCMTQVCFQRRASPLLARMLEQCRAYSHIVHASVSFFKHSPKPFLGARGHMLDDGIHAIDTLRHICAGEVRRIHSVARRIGGADIDFFTSLLEFDNGTTGQLCCNWTAGRRSFQVAMHASSISAEADLEGKGCLHANGDDTRTIELDAREAGGSNDRIVYCGFQAKIGQFLTSLETRIPPESNFSDALKTHAVAERILAMNVLGIHAADMVAPTR